MRYVESRIEQNARDETYRFYMARSLQLAPQNKCIIPTLQEIYNMKPDENVNKKGEEIVENVMLNAGLSFGD